LLGKRQIESSNPDKSPEKTVEKNQFQHIQASGGFKKSLEVEVVQFFGSFYTIKPLQPTALD